MHRDATVTVRQSPSVPFAAPRPEIANRALAELGPIGRLRALIGRHVSVRWKLTLWYGVMCLAILGIVGLGMRAALHQQINASIDSTLRETAGRMQQSLATSLVAPGLKVSLNPACEKFGVSVQQYCLQVKRDLDLHSQELTAPGQVEQIVLDEYPQVIPGRAASPSVNRTLTPSGHGQIPMGNSIEQISLPIRVAQTGTPQYASVNVNGQDLRAYVVAISPPPAIRDQGVYGVLEIFQNRQTYDGIERTFDFILFLGIPLGLLVALVAGWWIARAALRPIDRFSRTVKAIGESRDLARRLNFIGPSDEVGRLAETFDGMMERLQRAFETQKRFVADASHELRTPLTAIRGNADLMAFAPIEEREACLAAIRKEANRMSRLVGDLLLLAEADVESQPLQLRTVDLDELLLEVHHSATVLADGRVQVVLERADSVSLQLDPDRIQQLLLNLVDNAVKFTPEGGVVTLSLAARDSDVLLEVSDSGVGIPTEDQALIFDRFYRVEEARSTRGSGLGLAICAWIVSAHGGRISVRSQPGMGSTFAITFPYPRVETTPIADHPYGARRRVVR